MQETTNNRVAPEGTGIRDAWKSDSPKVRRESIIREFALNTSTHGLPGIARSQSKHNCIFWTISFFIFTGVMIFFVTRTIMDYFQYPTQTSISIVIERSQTFPAVTFCNYAPARFDRVIGPFLNYTNSINVTNSNDTTTFTLLQATYLRQFFQEQLNAGDPVDQYFFSIDTMLMNCSYNGIVCTANDFISFLSSVHGLCFTFNAKTKGLNGSVVRRTSDGGGPGKLQLRLYAQSHLYIPYVSEDVTAGMVVMIHDNTQLPQVDIASIELAPGRKHKLSYKKRTTYFLASPYTECTDKIPLVMQAMFRRYEGADYGYSQALCYTLCAQAYIYQECGCVSPTEWSARSIVLPGTDKVIEAPLCKPSNSCYSEAAIRLTSTITIWDQFCSHCTGECSTVDFLVTPSSVPAPSAFFIQLTKAFVESTSVSLPVNWTTNWISEIQNNYVSLDVVCESTQIENYTQNPSISAVDVLSNVGGHTGLWIGISFLSLMEFVEMVYRILRHECHNVCRSFYRKIHKPPR